MTFWSGRMCMFFYFVVKYTKLVKLDWTSFIWIIYCEWSSRNFEPQFLTRLNNANIKSIFASVAPKSVKIDGPHEARVNETVTLTCTSENSNPAADITWNSDKEGIVFNSTSRSYLAPEGGWITTSNITYTVRADDKIVFMCHGNNKNLLQNVVKTHSLSVICKWQLQLLILRQTLFLLQTLTMFLKWNWLNFLTFQLNKYLTCRQLIICLQSYLASRETLHILIVYP